MKNKQLPLIVLFAATGKAKTLVELRQERAEKVEAQQEIADEVKESETRDFTEDQEKRFDDLDSEIKDLDKRIARRAKLEEAEKRTAGLKGKPVEGKNGGKDKPEGGEGKEKRSVLSRASIATALRSVRSGKALEGAEKEMNDIAIEESRNAKVEIPDNATLNIPMSMMRADAQTVTEDAGDYGGELVQNQAPRMQMPFAPKTFLEKLGATRWTGLTGGDIPLPVGSNYNYSWLGETEEVALQKQKFEGPTMSPNRLAAAVDISNRLLLQSSVNVEGTIRQLLFQGYDRAINIAAINGSGANNQPTGILNTTGVQQSAIATAAAVPTKAMLDELPGLLEAADVSEESLGFLMNATLRPILQNIKVDAGSGKFLMEKRNELVDYLAVVSNLVPDLSGNKALIFGDWSKLFIGEWGSMSLVTDPYSAARKNSLRLIVNGHADVGIAQPDAFAVNKFLTDSVA